MADGKDYISCPDELGSIHISEDVLAVTAAAAALEVEGVGGLPANLGSDIAELLAGRKNLSKGVRVNVNEERVTVEISAAAHQGTRQLVGKAAEMLSVLPPVTVYEPEYVPRAPAVDSSAPLDIRRSDDGTWLVDGPWLQRLMGNVNFADYESRMWFDKTLRESGLFQRLEEMGIQDGDTVSMYDWEFEYQR